MSEEYTEKDYWEGKVPDELLKSILKSMVMNTLLLITTKSHQGINYGTI